VTSEKINLVRKKVSVIVPTNEVVLVVFVRERTVVVIAVKLVIVVISKTVLTKFITFVL